jgi:nitrogen regulatory protein PII
MKKLEAIIDPVSLHEVRQALEAVGLTDLILSDVRGTDNTERIPRSTEAWSTPSISSSS